MGRSSLRTKPTLTVADVQTIAQACRNEAIKLQLQVAIAIVDDGGHLLYFERLEAKTSTVAVAIAKARTSALMRAPSGMLEQRVQKNTAFLALDAMPLPGGMPLILNNDCLGAIGVSGATGAQDECIASAGCETLLSLPIF